jgi:hypothetical protein
MNVGSGPQGDLARKNSLNVLNADPRSKVSSTRQEGVHRHDATRELPVADRLASAIERKVQDLARPLIRARSKTSQKSAPAYRRRLGPRRAGVSRCANTCARFLSAVADPSIARRATAARPFRHTSLPPGRTRSDRPLSCGAARSAVRSGTTAQGHEE